MPAAAPEPTPPRPLGCVDNLVDWQDSVLVPLTVVGVQVVVVKKLELDPDCDAGTSADVDGLVSEDADPVDVALVIGNATKTVPGKFTFIESGRPDGRSPKKDTNVAETAS